MLIDNLDLSIGRNIGRRLFSILRLDFNYGPQVNLLSSIIPRCFTCEVVGITKPWCFSDGESFL